MADRPQLPLRLRPDEDLESALRAMGGEIAWPAAAPEGGGPDIAMLVAARLAGASGRAGRADAPAKPAGAPARPDDARSRPRWTWRPARRALLVAVIVLFALAALVGAAGLGLPGLRFVFGGPDASPVASPTPAASPSGGAGASGAVSPGPSATSIPSRTPVPGPPGAGLGLGTRVSLESVDQEAGFAVLRPSDPSVGAPDAAWVDAARNDQVSLVWAASDRLPETAEPGIGLIEMAFRGNVDEGWFKKILGAGTIVEPVLVNGNRGYWVSGDPHFFFYEGPSGIVEDSRRWVGDVLIWADGPITYRLETSLGRDAAIALAESMN